MGFGQGIFKDVPSCMDGIQVMSVQTLLRGRSHVHLLQTLSGGRGGGGGEGGRGGGGGRGGRGRGGGGG